MRAHVFGWVRERERDYNIRMVKLKNLNDVCVNVVTISSSERRKSCEVAKVLITVWEQTGNVLFFLNFFYYYLLDTFPHLQWTISSGYALVSKIVILIGWSGSLLRLLLTRSHTEHPVYFQYICIYFTIHGCCIGYTKSMDFLWTLILLKYLGSDGRLDWVILLHFSLTVLITR